MQGFVEAVEPTLQSCIRGALNQPAFFLVPCRVLELISFLCRWSDPTRIKALWQNKCYFTYFVYFIIWTCMHTYIGPEIGER